MSLSEIDTIILVMMENRSFDHMLGYLSVDGSLPVDGIQKDPAWSEKYANVGPSGSIRPYELGASEQSFADPQHDEVSISLQINSGTAGGAAQMGGFVSSYVKYCD